MTRYVRQVRRASWRTVFLVLLLVLPGGAGGHDLPDELDLRIMVKPEGERLHVIARIPLALLEGQALPKRGADLLDLARIDEPLERAALAVARTFVFFEDQERLSPDRAIWRISLPAAPPFTSFEFARLQLFSPPLPSDTDVVWNDGWFDVYFLYPIDRPDAALSLAPQIYGLGGIMSLHVDFVPPHGPMVTYDVAPEDRVIALGAG